MVYMLLYSDQDYSQIIFILIQTIFLRKPTHLNWKEVVLIRKTRNDLEMESFQNLRKKHFKNPLMGYLNINSLINKITDLRETVKYLE